MANEWYSQIESTILTIVQYELQGKINAPYPNLNCTTKNQYSKPSIFPTLYLHMLNPLEEAQDLENDEVNAILATIELQVYSNKSEVEANKIMTKAISVMKSLHWNITMFPDPTTNDNVSTAIARVRKLVTELDVQ